MNKIDFANCFYNYLPNLLSGRWISKTAEVAKSCFNFKNLTVPAINFAPLSVSSCAIWGGVAFIAIAIAAVRKAGEKPRTLWQDPGRVITHLTNTTPQPEEAGATFELLIKGISDSQHNKISEPDLQTIIKLFFEKYPAIDLSLVDMHLSGLLSNEVNLPIFRAIINHCPGIENHLVDALTHAIKNESPAYTKIILDKQPQLLDKLSSIFQRYLDKKIKVGFCDWIVDHYFNNLEETTVVWLMANLVFTNIYDENLEAVKLFEKIVDKKIKITKDNYTYICEAINLLNINPDKFKNALKKMN